VSDFLIRLRKQRGLSQEELARELEISASYLSLLENGKRPASKHVLRKLATYLQIPVGYIVLQEFRVDELSERHRAVVTELRRELAEPALQHLFSKDGDLRPAAEPSDPKTPVYREQYAHHKSASSSVR
jgi:transcriptional regulator with XRE-family HTH domain